jgi:hypothetical protein
VRDVLTAGPFSAIWWPRFLLSVAALALVAWKGIGLHHGQAHAAHFPLQASMVNDEAHTAVLLCVHAEEAE